MTVWQRLTGRAGALGGLFTGAAGGGLEPSGAAPDIGVAFTGAIIALGAKMAKADGVVAAVEVDVFYQVFRTRPEDRPQVGRLFDQAKQDTAGFELYADRVRALLADDHHLLRDVLDGLFHIASADRALHPAEDRFLRVVAGRFGLSDSEFRHVRARFVVDPESPYDVLGLDPAVPDDTLKSRYRKLVRETHPDVLIGRGVPAAMIEMANRKLAAINEAYAAISAERGL